jgi:hypothetical protein
MEDFAPWNFGEWKEILSACTSAGESEAVRRATRTGEPLGSREFILGLERRMGKRLRVGDRGRPRKKPQPAEKGAVQGSLFAAIGE